MADEPWSGLLGSDLQRHRMWLRKRVGGKRCLEGSGMTPPRITGLGKRLRHSKEKVRNQIQIEIILARTAFHIIWHVQGR